MRQKAREMLDVVSESAAGPRPKKGANERGEAAPPGREAQRGEGIAPEAGALDGIVRALFALSWNRARELVERGKVSVDGKVVTTTTARVRKGAAIAFDLAARKPSAGNELPDAAIVFVDSHVVVVEKPAGVATVPFDPEGMGASIARRAAKGEEATLDERVRRTLMRRERTGGRSPELGVVHRLDKETSGLLVFTRSWAAKKALLSAFRFHHVHRRYLAIVYGVPQETTITSHFVEDRGDGLRGSVEHRRGRKHAVGNERTQRAVTHIKVLERLPGTRAKARCSLIECRLETGRTHQIRIHLSEAGHPVVGERVYIRGFDAPPLPAPRLMLHAAELGFTHPGTQEEVRYTSELPKDMTEILAFLRK